MLEKKDHNIDDSSWIANSLLIKTFLENKTQFDQLCQEVAYILENAINEEKIEYASISYRAKTLKSFLEKIVRKKYEDPFKEISDFSGARLVFLYNSDFERIEKVINRTFKVIEKVDKLNDKDVDKFGYGAIHYIIELNKRHSGARYDSLKNLRCEIQVRTVLQDAWSIIDHHLVYKNESSVPKVLRRKLNSIAALFETADDQFNLLREARESYIESVHESKNRPIEFLNTDLNIDSFKEYLLWKFPDLPLELFDGQVSICFQVIKHDKKFRKLIDLENTFNANLKQFERVKPKLSALENTNSSSAFLTINLALSSNIIKNNYLFADTWLRQINETP